MSLELKFWYRGLPFGRFGDNSDLKFWYRGLPDAAFSEATGPEEQFLTGTTGIPSSVVFGSGGIVAGPITGATGIPSSVAFGSGGDVKQLIVGTTGIPSHVVFGVGGEVKTMIVGATGIPSSVVFGAGGSVAGPIIGNAGIASHVAFGTDGNVSSNTITGVAGIPSHVAFGADGTVGSVGGPLTGFFGIPSHVAFGAGGSVAGPITGDTGIPSSVVFGVGGALVTLITGTTGIPSHVAFGTGGTVIRGIQGIFGIPSHVRFGTTGAVLPDAGENTNFRIYVNDVDHTDKLFVGSVSIERQLNFSASASFTLIDFPGSYAPAIGQPVILYYWTGTAWFRYFGGTVESSDLTKPRGDVAEPGSRYFAIVCADWGKALARRLVNKKYSQSQYGTLGSIFNDLSNILASEGITVALIADPGITMPDIEFAYIPLNQVLDRLCDLANLNWQVDWYKNLVVYDRPNLILNAPFDIDETSDNAKDITVHRDRGLYRNRQYIKATVAKTTTQIVRSYTFYFLEDTRDGFEYYRFADALGIYDSEWNGRVASIDRILVNGVPVVYADFGSYGSTPGYQIGQAQANSMWLGWNAFAFAPGIPVPGDVWEVTFQVNNDTPDQIVVENAVEIAARRAIEGGSGLYEDLFEVPNVNDPVLLAELAQSLLDRFGVMALEILYTTYTFGLETGQQQNQTLPEYGSDIDPSTLTIESISSKEYDKTQFVHTVRVSNQIQQRDAMTAFKRFLAKLQQPQRTQEFVMTWDIATTYVGLPNPGLVVGNGLGNERIIMKDITLNRIELRFREAPTGSAARIRLRADGITIFAGTGYIEFPDGGSGTVVFRDFANAPLTLPKGTVMDLDILQKGSVVAGKDAVLELIGFV